MANTRPPVCAWPARAWPSINRIGRYVQIDKLFRINHRVPTLAVHLYNYRATVTIAGTAHEIAPGDLTICPPLTPMAFHAREDSRQHICAHLEPPTERGPSLSLPHHLTLGPLAVEARDRLEHVIADHLAAQAGDRAALVAAAAGMQSFLCWIASVATRRDPAAATPRTSLERAETLLREGPSQLTVEEIARCAGMNHKRLSRLFRERHGMGMVRYRWQVKVDLAKWQLELGNRPVAEIGAAVGLPDPHYFNKVFRSITGVSPSAWRRLRSPLK